MKVIWLLTALVAGMMAPVQAGFNGKMGRAIGDPVYAALISFFVGTLGLLAYGLVLRMDFTAVRQAAGIERWVWLAGLLGAFYVTSVIILTPRLGATLTFSLVVAGQLLMAVALDHYGLLGVPVQPISWLRILGIALITAGVVLIRKF
jgi:transporter family-2 protein